MGLICSSPPPEQLSGSGHSGALAPPAAAGTPLQDTKNKIKKLDKVQFNLMHTNKQKQL